jgi:DNA repair protein RadC
MVKMKNAYRLEVVRTRIAEPGERMNSPAEVGRHYAHLQKYDREHLIRLDLDNRNRVIGEETVSIGTGEAALISPREVFRGALLSGAAHIIILHNHPSGDPAPSREDRAVEEKLREAGELLAIPVIDFVIIGENGRYWSSTQ